MHNCSPIHMYTMKELTTRQIEILDFITNYEWRHGFWPSIRNIQMEFDYKSTNAVMGHLSALERKGAIERIPGQARTFRINRPDKPQASFESEIPENASEVVEIPVYGAIAAGYPDRVESSGAVGKLQVDIQNAGFTNASRKQSFALEVRGDSMVDAQIYDGDRVIIEPREARDGDIVAALIDGEVTLKRLIQKAGEPPYLKAENKNYPDLHPLNNLEIQGVAKAVVRAL